MQELYDELRVRGEIFLPIYKIDGIVVNSRLYTSNNGWYVDPFTFYLEFCLNSHSHYKYLDSGSTLEEFTTMIEGLQHMKFDTFSGEFINPSKLVKSMYTPRVMSMFHHPNIEMDYTECCVCMEYTVSKTPCNHPLCLRCDQQIKNKMCPLCRSDTSLDEIN
jgi:hypothetical protein